MTMGHSQRRGTPYDLILKGGRVLDPSQALDRVGDIAIVDDKIAAIESSISPELAFRTIDVDGLLVTPGLIDLHVHCNTHHDPEAIDPDVAGVMQGITRIVSPGDVGAYTFQAFRKHVVERASTRVSCWLSAAAHGGVVYGLNNTTYAMHPKLMDVEAAIQTIEAFPDIIRGVKMVEVNVGVGERSGTLDRGHRAGLAIRDASQPRTTAVIRRHHAHEDSQTSDTRSGSHSRRNRNSVAGQRPRSDVGTRRQHAVDEVRQSRVRRKLAST